MTSQRELNALTCPSLLIPRGLGNSIQGLQKSCDNSTVHDRSLTTGYNDNTPQRTTTIHLYQRLSTPVGISLEFQSESSNEIPIGTFLARPDQSYPSSKANPNSHCTTSPKKTIQYNKGVHPPKPPSTRGTPINPPPKWTPPSTPPHNPPLPSKPPS